MLSCLIEVDSTVEVTSDGVVQCMQQYKGSSYQDSSPGSRGDSTLILVGKLLDANPDVATYRNSGIFHSACSCLRGELGIDMLSLFLTKNSEGIKSINFVFLPIHSAAANSSLDMIKFLLKVHPESFSMVKSGQGNRVGSNLLHHACQNKSNIADAKAIVEYLCKLYPALVNMKSISGNTPLHQALGIQGELNMEVVKVLCNTDESVVREKESALQQLPLHLLIAYKPPRIEVSDEGDCFCLFLQLYPASAGVKDGHLKTPYDLAVSKGLSVYFIRLLLNANPCIDPIKKRNLNYAARREGLFLAFRALCATHEPIIWAKLRNEGDRDLLRRVISYL
jgi:ankyrin repeat protein